MKDKELEKDVEILAKRLFKIYKKKIPLTNPYSWDMLLSQRKEAFRSQAKYVIKNYIRESTTN